MKMKDVDLSDVHQRYNLSYVNRRLQNRAKTLTENPRLKDGWRCNWLSVSNIIQFDKAVMIYKVEDGLCPDSLVLAQKNGIRQPKI